MAAPRCHLSAEDRPRDAEGRASVCEIVTGPPAGFCAVSRIIQWLIETLTWRALGATLDQSGWLNRQDLRFSIFSAVASVKIFRKSSQNILVGCKDGGANDPDSRKARHFTRIARGLLQVLKRIPHPGERTRRSPTPPSRRFLQPLSSNEPNRVSHHTNASGYALIMGRISSAAAGVLKCHTHGDLLVAFQNGRPVFGFVAYD